MLNCQREGWGAEGGGLMMLGQMAFSSSCAGLSGTRSLRGQACQNHSVHSLPNKVWTVSLFRLINLRFFFCQRLNNTLQLDDLNLPMHLQAQWKRWHLCLNTLQNMWTYVRFCLLDCNGRCFVNETYSWVKKHFDCEHCMTMMNAYFNMFM